MWVAPTGPSWMDPLVAYLRDERLPADGKAAHRVRCQAASYFLSPAGQLYRRTHIGPDLRVLHEEEVPPVLQELHEGSSGCHSGGRGTGRTPFSLAYGMEAVLPLAATAPTDRTEDFHPATNEEHIASELNHVEDLCDEAHIRHAAY
ncbi:hypothetical protein Vadar_028420 [Vaccinium darrowii]|uniref:Uncharacterized protein n=1 Tax=Vaccinium darrowii TaxID=229202 RepID=A0ACB7Y9W2_9ERIC|nr:hypothetical protein Vadar_028420 [Vaccinium darrowii]